MEEKNVLTISHLSKHLGSRLILDDISVEIKEGEIFGFVGPNGSGKTTTIKVMLGLLTLERGDVFICGHNIKTEFAQAMSNVGGIIENPEMYGYLSGRENLKQYHRMYDGIPESRIDEVVSLVGLSDRINDKISKYSLGMRQRLGLAQALLNKPRLLVLDEPTNGLDPMGIKELRDILKKVSHEEGTAVFISSHQLAELDLMCDRFGVIDKGRVIAVRSMDEIRTSARQNVELFEIETEENAVPYAAAVLDRIGNGYAVNGEKLSVTADLSAGGKGISETVRELVMAGIPILSAMRVKHSLEDAFIEITTGMTAGSVPFEAPPAAQDTPPTPPPNMFSAPEIEDTEGGERK